MERTIAWLVAFRQLTIRYDRHAASVLAFLHLACTLICRRFLRRAGAGYDRPFDEAGADRWYPRGVKRVLLTGMSGTGKSTLILELAALGYKAIDADERGWSELVSAPGDPGISASAPGRDWVWREDRIHRLLSTEDADVLFVSGCATNQVKFYSQFDHIVLLSALVPLMAARLATRPTNSYGKDPDELAMVLHHTRTVEPLLRRTASLEVDTSVTVEQAVAAILGHVWP